MPGANLAPGYAHVAQEDLELRLAREAKLIQSGTAAIGKLPLPTDREGYERQLADPELSFSDEELEALLTQGLKFSAVERPNGPLGRERTNLGAFRRQGSNELLLVGMPGFEPGTSASRTLRANQAALHPVTGRRA